MSAAKQVEQMRQRKQQMLILGLERQIDEDYVGASAILQLLYGSGKEREANEKLARTARWFVPPCPCFGRDPKGECDFAALKLIRALYMAEERLFSETKEEILKFFTTHDFESKYKSENHMLLFHVSRHLIGQKEPQQDFVQYGATGEKLCREDEAFLMDYLRFRAKRGWAEFDSCGYIGEDFCALLTLFDFTQSIELKKLAEMSLNVLLLDMLSDCLGPLYCGAHGRIYEGTALNHLNSQMMAVYWLYFGSEYQKAAEKYPMLELIVSTFIPAAYVYKVLEQKPSEYENYESSHLHCISTEIPHKQVEQVEGSISKYTYITPYYGIGAVNFQDPYPEESDAKWYAHHQQHEWDLTLAGGTDIKIFSHHPGSFGTEGQEHGYWTGDLGCCCGHFYCHKNIALSVYDIPSQEMQWIHAHVPLKYFEHKRDGNYLFLKREHVYVALWFSNGYYFTEEGEYAGIEVRSEGGQHGVICEVGDDRIYSDFEAFIQAVKQAEIKFDSNEMTLAYKSLYLSKTERRHAGKTVAFPYPTYWSPMMQEEQGSGIIQVFTKEENVFLDFNRVAAVIEPRVLPMDI